MSKPKKSEDIAKILAEVKKKLDEAGLAYFCVAELPGTKEGASIFEGKADIKNAAHNARNAHMKWEVDHGIDPDHDSTPKDIGKKTNRHNW